MIFTAMRQFDRFKWLLLFLVALPLGAQRINDRVVTTVSPPPVGGLPPILGVPGALITVCQYPANGVPCTNVATTYTDATLTTTCPLSQQIVPNGSAVCTNTADQLGGWGIYVPAGCYTYTTQNPRTSATAGPFTVCSGSSGGGGGGGGIFIHNLSGSNPSAVINSIYTPAIDINYLVLTANANAIVLPPQGQVADGEILYFTISQAQSGSAFTITAGSVANAPVTPGTNTTLQSALSGGCPNLGSIVSLTAPSQLFVSVQYSAAYSSYTLLGCESSNPAAVAIVEGPITSGVGQFGAYLAGTPIGGFVAVNNGHFTNLSIISLGGQCATPPTFNVFANATTFGVPLQAVAGAQAPGGATNQAQTLPYISGMNIGIYVSTPGIGCNYAYFSVTASIGEP